MTEIEWRADNIETIDGFLSASECVDFIRFGEKIGFEEAPVSATGGPVLMKDVRNNDRVMIEGSQNTWHPRFWANGSRSD